MVDHQDPIDADLDAGLRAAFRAGETLATGVLAEIEERVGPTRVLLVEAVDDDDDPVIDPASSAVEEASRSRYEIHGEIARGGVGVILKGRDADLGRDIAMKVLQPRHAMNPAMVRRFVEEAQVAGQLQHPGVLPVYELGLQADRRPYFTMKLVKGRTMSAILADRDGAHAERGRLTTIFLQVCQTIAYAHSRGVVHRDIKPANIMVGAFGEVQVVDWGLAKVLGRKERVTGATVPDQTHVETVRTNEPSSQSIAGSVLGTPAYMAPEQARGDVDAIDRRADVFALGGVLCEILTGEPPFIGSDPMAAAAAGQLEPCHDRLDACDADDDLVDLARACLSVDPSARPRDAKVVADRLAEHMASSEERARDAERAVIEAEAKAASERRARRLTLALAVVILVAIGAGAAGLVWQENTRAQRVAESSQRVGDALNAARLLFEQAQHSTAGDSATWTALRAAHDTVHDLAAAGSLDDETEARVETFLEAFAAADTDRRMIERIEELVIFGATHEDLESWTRMESDLRGAYRDYGLDLDELTPDEVAERIRNSPLAPQLTNGLELWVATCAHLGQMGDGRSMETMMAWASMLPQADPDPYRTAIRELLYMPDPSVAIDRLDELANSPEFDEALPRTKSWLASVYWRVNDIDTGVEVFKRALRMDPNDLMLNFDIGYFLAGSQRWEEAVWYYHRALAIQSSGGVWRSLGRALRETDRLDDSLDAFDESIAIQGDYAPTWIDRGLTLMALGRVDDAIASYREALVVQPDMPMAHCRLGLALQEAGRLEEALVELRVGHRLGSNEPWWNHPSEAWVNACEALIAGSVASEED